MKLKNNPTRKLQRRQNALTQLHRAKNTKATRLDRASGFDRKAEQEKLESLLMPPSVARGIRTKKDRSSRGRLTR